MLHQAAPRIFGATSPAWEGDEGENGPKQCRHIVWAISRFFFFSFMFYYYLLIYSNTIRTNTPFSSHGLAFSLPQLPPTPDFAATSPTYTRFRTAASSWVSFPLPTSRVTICWNLGGRRWDSRREGSSRRDTSRAPGMFLFVYLKNILLTVISATYSYEMNM